MRLLKRQQMAKLKGLLRLRLALMKRGQPSAHGGRRRSVVLVVMVVLAIMVVPWAGCFAWVVHVVVGP